MSSTTSLLTNPVRPSPTTAWDANIWPEYPLIRYWHDLAYEPSRRPFYPFVHASIMMTPHLRRREVEVQEQKALSIHERHWRETQEYWWNWNNEHGGGNVMEQMVGKDPNCENERQVWTVTLASVATEFHNLAAHIKAHKLPSMPFMPITKDNTFSAVLGLLTLIIFIGFCASIAVLVSSLLCIFVDGLFLQKYGKLRWISQPPTVRYENVPCVRGWAVAAPNCLGSVLLRHQRTVLEGGCVG